MLSHHARLKKEKDFNRVWRKGKSFFSNYIIIKIQKNNTKHSRFGIVVSNKISKKATKRNRLKRQIREIIRLKLNHIKPGYDCVIVVGSGILDKKYPEIEQEIKKTLFKARLIK